MDVKGICEGCGNERMLRDGLCFPCDGEARAKAPPQELLDMRWVYEGQPPQTPMQRALKQLLEQNPREFLLQKRGSERDYRQHLQKTAAKPAKEGQLRESAVEEADEGRDRVLELLGEEWERVQVAVAAAGREDESVLSGVAGGEGVRDGGGSGGVSGSVPG
jgi:hypothetical protein